VLTIRKDTERTRARVTQLMRKGGV